MLYLIKFSKTIGGSRHRAGFYLGYCEDGRLDDRIEEHRSGHGARITAAAVKAGAELQVVATWPGDRKDERRLKKRKSHARLLARHGGKQSA